MFDLANLLTNPGSAFVQQVRDGLQALTNPGRALEGLITSNNDTDAVNDVDYTAGKAAADDGSAILNGVNATHVKQIDVVFAEYVAIGTPSGGRDSSDNLTGAKWFRNYIIGATGKDDQGFLSTSDSPTLPTGFTKKARISYLHWTGSTIRAFTQLLEKFFQWTAPPLDVDTNNPGTARVLATVTAAPNSMGVFRIGLISAATDAAILTVGAVAETDAAPSKSATPLATLEVAAGEDQFIGPVEIPVDSNSQIAYRLSNSTANITVRILTVGYKDQTGRG